jgi:colanic acid biosynthesis glycosyl transferase WcaI
VRTDDPHALAVAVKELAADTALRARLGGWARAYAVEHLGKEQVLSRFEQQLMQAGHPVESLEAVLK